MAQADEQHRFTQELEVAGHQVVNELARLLAEGNVRRIVLKSESGDIVVTVPLSAGAVVGGAVVLAAPWLALLGAIIGLSRKLRIEVVRTDTSDDTPPDTGEVALGSD